MATIPDPDFPLAAFLGMTIEQAARGVATARVTVTPAHINPHGSVHGAVLFALADTAMGAATMGVIAEGERCASIDVQVRFCRAVFGGSLAATATVRHAGKRIVQLAAEIADGDGQLVAFATGSFAVIPGQSPTGAAAADPAPSATA